MSSRVLPPSLLTLGALGLAACSNDSTPPDNTVPDTLGSIRITTRTSGVNLDPDGYTALIQNDSMALQLHRPVGINGTVDFPDLKPAGYIVYLKGVQFTCTSTTGAPPQYGDFFEFAEVTAGATSDLVYEISCTTPPAGRLLFDSGRDGGGLSVINADGSGLSELTCGGDAAWSPDGSRIAVACVGDIVVINADGSGRVNVTNGVGINGSPSWSPDGNRLVFSNRVSLSDEPHLYVINVDGSHLQPLVQGFLSEDHPDWSPRGDQIVFEGVLADSTLTWQDRSGIFLVGVDGTGVVHVVQPVMYDHTPAWSPDGTRIAFHRIDRKNYRGDIFVMNADGTGLTRVGLDAVAFRPCWSPDGTKIAFTREANWDIMFVNVDGTQVANFTQTDWDPYTNSGYEAVEDWGP